MKQDDVSIWASKEQVERYDRSDKDTIPEQAWAWAERMREIQSESLEDMRKRQEDKELRSRVVIDLKNNRAVSRYLKNKIKGDSSLSSYFRRRWLEGFTSEFKTQYQIQQEKETANEPIY